MKATLKAQLAAEVAHVWKVRPDLPLVAVAAPDNWTFLQQFPLRLKTLGKYGVGKKFFVDFSR